MSQNAKPTRFLNTSRHGGHLQGWWETPLKPSDISPSLNPHGGWLIRHGTQEPSLPGRGSWGSHRLNPAWPGLHFSSEQSGKRYAKRFLQEDGKHLFCVSIRSHLKWVLTKNRGDFSSQDPARSWTERPRTRSRTPPWHPADVHRARFPTLKA